MRQAYGVWVWKFEQVGWMVMVYATWYRSNKGLDHKCKAFEESVHGPQLITH